MESDSSAKALLNLFSSSNLKSYAPATSRIFYAASDPSGSKEEEGETVPMEQPKKRRRLSGTAGGWSQAEMRALETYRSIVELDGTVGGEVRDILLPNRTEEEIQVRMRKFKDQSAKLKRTRLLDLEKQESEELEREIERRKKNLDELLDRGNDVWAGGPVGSAREGDTEGKEGNAENKREVTSAQTSLDKILGLMQETAEQKRKRALDEALGLTSD